MSNEFDYSGLYNHTTGEGSPQEQSPAQNPDTQNTQQPQDGGYPNESSSGMNTAKTACTG